MWLKVCAKRWNGCFLLPGDEIVAATIHLDRLNKNEVLQILKVLEPYDDNVKVVTKKELSVDAGLGLDAAQVNVTWVGPG